MNKVILLVFLMPLPALGQIMENFESGNLSGWIQSPEGRWNTDNLNPVSGLFSLHHSYDNPDAGSDMIGLAVKNLHPEKGVVKWNFTVRHGYDPSASNNWALFVMSDSDPESAQNNPILNGYAVGVNQAGYDDTLRLWKVKGGTYSTVVSSGINWQAEIGADDPVKISLERSAAGEWRLFVSRMNSSLIGSSSVIDTELFRHEWLIILYRYTSSRDRLLWLDDITVDGVFQDDNEPPEIDVIAVRPDPGDVIISEIMADPLPAVSLPDREYIEIFNRTGFPFNLKNWKLSDGNSVCTFPEKIILPANYMILCQVQDTSLFKGFGNVTGLKSFPALTDGGKILFISDNTGNLIHGVEYSSDWYNDDLKTGGGWSLELVDTEYPFSMEDNWHASLSRTGGTPGLMNSVSRKNPDRVFSGIENVFPSDSLSISLSFSEPVFNITKNLKSIRTGGPEIYNIEASDPLMRKYILHLKESLQKDRIYTLRIGEGITDFAGNRIKKSEFSFGIPECARQGDILFNELLFNPFPAEPDFIEFFNCSERIIDASDLLVVSVNDELNDTSSATIVLREKRCILPGNYIAVTTDRKALTDRFFSSGPDKIFEIASLPSMPDDEGHLILYGHQLDKIDEVFYDEDMHYSLLGGFEGISLEKIRTNAKSYDKSQWHSASEISGWGTPGAPNSVISDQPGNGDIVNLSSTRITPDNDGFEDFLVIDLKLKGIGNVVSVTVFDETGGFVKKAAGNLLAGSEASIVWNGTEDDEKLVSTGIYIILISVFDDSGKVLNWKKVCTVIR
jgi:hypothetical protein